LLSPKIAATAKAAAINLDRWAAQQQMGSIKEPRQEQLLLTAVADAGVCADDNAINFTNVSLPLSVKTYSK
jgi:hypothetical protein